MQQKKNNVRRGGPETSRTQRRLLTQQHRAVHRLEIRGAQAKPIQSRSQRMPRIVATIPHGAMRTTRQIAATQSAHLLAERIKDFERHLFVGAQNIKGDYDAGIKKRLS